MAMVGNGGVVPPIRHSVAACPGLSGWLFSGPSREDEAWVERWIQVAKRCGGSGWKGSCRALGQWPNSVAERACRRHDRIKVLSWQGDGFAIWHKRLEAGTYALPASEGEPLRLSPTQLTLLLGGIDLLPHDDRRVVRSSAIICRYVCERQRKPLSEEERYQRRQEIAVPILAEFHQWLQGQSVNVLPKSKIGEAVSYALNQWDAWVRYCEAGYLSIDNNLSEQMVKPCAMGRKAWLFLGSENGGDPVLVDGQRQGESGASVLLPSRCLRPAAGGDSRSLDPAAPAGRL